MNNSNGQWPFRGVLLSMSYAGRETTGIAHPDRANDYIQVSELDNYLGELKETVERRSLYSLKRAISPAMITLLFGLRK